MKHNLFVRTCCIFIIPVLLFAFFSIASKGFGIGSIKVVLTQTMIPMSMALGVAFTFIVGIFEMSVGAQVILSAVAGGILYQSFGAAGLFVGAVVTGALCGLSMGLVYKFLRIPTMVISLGMLMLFEVIASLLTKGVGYVSINADVAIFGRAPLIFIIVGIAAVIFYIIFYLTKFGHGIRALGSNDYVAVNLGLNNTKLKLSTYVIGGAFYGVAGVLVLCYAGSISAKTEMGSLSMMFPPIISVLIGLELRNIVNNFPLTILIGAFSVSVLSSGMIAVGLPAAMQDLITGVFMLGVMIFSTNSENIGKYFRNKKLINNIKMSSEKN